MPRTPASSSAKPAAKTYIIANEGSGAMTIRNEASLLIGGMQIMLEHWDDEGVHPSKEWMKAALLVVEKLAENLPPTVTDSP